MGLGRPTKEYTPASIPPLTSPEHSQAQYQETNHATVTPHTPSLSTLQWHLVQT